MFEHSYEIEKMTTFHTLDMYNQVTKNRQIQEMKKAKKRKPMRYVNFLQILLTRYC